MSIYLERFNVFFNYKQVKKKHLYDNWNLVMDLMELLWWTQTPHEAIYCLKQNILEPPICANCGVKTAKYTTCNYNYYCDDRECKYNKGRMPFSDPKILEKCRKTLKERYGVENCSSIDWVKEKKKDTCNKNYGCDNPLKSDEIKSRIRDTNIERYGTPYVSQSEQIKDKIKNTNLERYGHEHYWGSEEGKLKNKQTFIDKYGVDNPLKFAEFRQKAQQTLIKNYDVRSPFESKYIRSKSQETLYKNYGVDNPARSPIIYERMTNTLFEKYGVYHPMHCTELFNKCFSKHNYIDSTGHEHSVQGYEDICIEYFINNDMEFVSDQKIINSIPYDSGNKRYYPDLMLSSGTFIEVKSEYTLKESLDKMISVFDENQNIELHIYIFSNRNSTEPSNILRSKEDLIEWSNTQ